MKLSISRLRPKHGNKSFIKLRKSCQAIFLHPALPVHNILETFDVLIRPCSQDDNKIFSICVFLQSKDKIGRKIHDSIDDANDSSKNDWLSSANKQKKSPLASRHIFSLEIMMNDSDFDKNGRRKIIKFYFHRKTTRFYTALAEEVKSFYRRS